MSLLAIFTICRIAQPISFEGCWFGEHFLRATVGRWRRVRLCRILTTRSDWSNVRGVGCEAGRYFTWPVPQNLAAVIKLPKWVVSTIIVCLMEYVVGASLAVPNLQRSANMGCSSKLILSYTSNKCAPAFRVVSLYRLFGKGLVIAQLWPRDRVVAKGSTK